MQETINNKFLILNNKIASIILISLLGTWIVSFPYEGQLLNTLAKSYGYDYTELIEISLIMLIVGLIVGGIFVRTKEIAKNSIKFLIPVCIICTLTFLFPAYDVWMITLNLCSIIGGICITATGYYFKNVSLDNRFKNVAEMLIIITILRTLINNLSIYISIKVGMIFTILLLVAVWYLSLKIQFSYDKNIKYHEFNKKAGYKALFLLFIFIAIIAIDFGIMTTTINPKYNNHEWLTSWYGELPYAAALLLIRNFVKVENRNNIHYIGVGMIGFGFILFLIMDNSISSYLIITTIMMGAWSIWDLFWWSILAEMIEMANNSAKILGAGFSALMIGVLVGNLLGENNTRIFNAELPIVPMAVICISLLILPILHELLSKMIKKNEKPKDFNDNTISFEYESFTEREKQITDLLLKGRTIKLISEEIGLSENTVKTHIKSIYNKTGVKTRSELFNIMIKKS